MHSELMCVVLVIAGQVLTTEAISYKCNNNDTITITVLPSDTDYLNKTIAPINENCSGQYGPVSSTGGVYYIPECSDNNTFTRDTEYLFSFHAVSGIVTANDKVISLICESYNGQIQTVFTNFSANVGVPSTLPPPDVVTDIYTPSLTMVIQKTSSAVTVVTIGDPLTIRVAVDTFDAGDFSIIIEQVSLTSDVRTVQVLDAVSHCSNADGKTLGFTDQVDVSAGNDSTVMEIDFPAFIMTDSSGTLTTIGASIVVSVVVGVCTLGDAECIPSNCSESTRRRKRDVEDPSYNRYTDMSKSVLVFPSEETMNEFLGGVSRQIETGVEEDGPVVCVETTVSISVIAILSVLLVLGSATAAVLHFRSHETITCLHSASTVGDQTK